jgi:hypothetical protein
LYRYSLLILRGCGLLCGFVLTVRLRFAFASCFCCMASVVDFRFFLAGFLWLWLG